MEELLVTAVGYLKLAVEAVGAAIVGVHFASAEVLVDNVQVGAKVVIADVSDERGEALAREVGAGYLYVPTDCMDEDASAEAVKVVAATVAEGLEIAHVEGPFDVGDRGPDSAGRGRHRRGVRDQGVLPRDAGGRAEQRSGPLGGPPGGGRRGRRQGGPPAQDCLLAGGPGGGRGDFARWPNFLEPPF